MGTETKVFFSSIYDRIKIVYYDESDVYGVMDLQDPLVWTTIWSGKDLETAKAVKKAYCDGYVDGKNKGE